MSVEEWWYDRSAAARIARAAVSPLAWLYGAVVSVRNALYDRAVLRVHSARIPVVSIGNITVGGTGKTPFSAHVIGALIASGHKPAVVMRGYGNDESQLHARLNPGVPVIAGADRVAGISSAVQAGADVVVLDDGFQHRRASRDLDVVLVSTEQWQRSRALLPAGPLREPLRALRRADLIVVTRKTGTEEQARSVARAVGALPRVAAGVAIVELAPSGLVSASTGSVLGLGDLRGRRVLAVAGVGDPASFFGQLRQLGAEVDERRFRDHHDYTADEAAHLSAETSGHKYAITTEKDAVKLARAWPADGPELWYLSQAVRPSEGYSLVASALANLFQRATSIAE